MSIPSTPGTRPRRRLHLVRLALLAGAVTAGCTGAGSPAASPAAPGSPAGASPAATLAAPASHAGPASPAAAPPTPVPTPTAVPPDAFPADPPVATLLAADVGVAGALGSYTWGGAGSDAPWILVPADDGVSVAGPYAVRFDPAIGGVAWRASWALVTVGGRAPVSAWAQGAGPVAFDGPEAGTGPWTLKLDASFGDRWNATWYWRLDPP